MQAMLNGKTTVHIRIEGQAKGRPTLAFANSLGTDARIWSGLAARLRRDYNLLFFDMRGHGLSDLGEAPYHTATYAGDMACLIDMAGLGPVIAIGVSVGGQIVQSLFHHRPELVRALVISNSAAKLGTAGSWGEHIASVKSRGMAGVSDGILKRWFTDDFAQSQPEQLALYRHMLERTPAEGYIACCEALGEADLTPLLRGITVPCLCIAGDCDSAVPPDVVKDTAERIQGSHFEIVGGAGHLPMVEKLDAYEKIARTFISRLDQ